MRKLRREDSGGFLRNARRGSPKRNVNVNLGVHEKVLYMGWPLGKSHQKDDISHQKGKVTHCQLNHHLKLFAYVEDTPMDSNRGPFPHGLLSQ